MPNGNEGDGNGRYEGGGDEITEEGGSVPGFSFPLLIVSLLIIVPLFRKRAKRT